MFHSRRRAPIARRPRGRHSRHGRELRSSAAGPFLPQLTGRIPRFHQVVGETVGFLRAMAPELMADVHVGVGTVPLGDPSEHGQGRWDVQPPNKVVVYRVPIERFVRLSLSEPRDQARYREYVEHTVIQAVNDLLDGRLEDKLGHGH